MGKQWKMKSRLTTEKKNNSPDKILTNENVLDVFVSTPIPTYHTSYINLSNRQIK